MMTLMWSALIALLLLVGWGIVVFVLRHIHEEKLDNGETRIRFGKEIGME